MSSFSVLMSVYYKEKPAYLKTSIESMLNQTIPPDEFVIVKDGPLSKELDAVIDTFIDKHVGVDRHTERQYDTGDTRHRKRRLERRQDSECEEEVDEQSEVCHHTRDEVIHENHVEHQEDERHGE